jgi:hypothetical protein
MPSSPAAKLGQTPRKPEILAIGLCVLKHILVDDELLCRNMMASCIKINTGLRGSERSHNKLYFKKTKKQHTQYKKG